MPLIRASKAIWRKTCYFIVHKVLMLDDTPHRIALGVSIGMFWTFMPVIGLQMILTGLTSFALRANKLVGMPFVWISNPATIIPCYVPSLFLGQWMLGKPVGEFEALNQAFEFEGGPIDTAMQWLEAVWSVAGELFLGCFVVSCIIAVASYFIFYRAIILYRRHRGHLHAKPAMGPEIPATPDDHFDSPPGP
ncbi:MAG: DUF2062 domain-containing protein [Phycisphaerales bacterium]|jgi:uncharacterized protein|nr:DUF2062 domain-containing protein [Phycisphaerales bacterium]MBT7171288.1 DUF2062 domain-containing protein [Phycisphaerales bacterium]